GSGAVEPLGPAVRTGTAHARRRAADSLGEISGRAAVSALIGIVEDADEDRAVREVAAWALDKYTEELLTDVQHALVAVMLGHWADVVFIGARAIGPLEAALQDDDEARRERAAQALADIGTREALDVLVASLPDRTQISQVKRVALEAIGGRGDDRTQPLAAAALNDADFEVRRSAAELLERKGWQPETCGDRILYAIAQERWDAVRAEGERAVPMLVEALDCPAIRPEAVQALVGTGDPGMTALVDVLSDETRPVPTREVAAMAVAAAGDERAIERLTAMLRDKDMAMRQMAVWALQRSGWEPKDDNGRAAILIANERWSELGDLGAAAVEPLLRLVTERMAVPEAVGALGDVLESAPERVSIRQLRAIHALRRMFQADAPRTGGSPDQIKVDGVRVDFSRIQQLAKRELFHRGIVVQ
ncbi:MAG: HEAT repeat domain-containing protein, partial [Phycisphaerae bacterium]